MAARRCMDGDPAHWFDYFDLIVLHDYPLTREQEPSFQSSEMFNTLCVTCIIYVEGERPLGRNDVFIGNDLVPSRGRYCASIPSSVEKARCNVTKLVRYVPNVRSTEEQPPGSRLQLAKHTAQLTRHVVETRLAAGVYLRRHNHLTARGCDKSPLSMSVRTCTRRNKWPWRLKPCESTHGSLLCGPVVTCNGR